MIIISVLASVLTMAGVYSTYKKHYVDAIGNISRNITANLEKVEISGVNIADEVKWHITSPELIMSTLSYEIAVNSNLASFQDCLCLHIEYFSGGC